MGPSSTARTRTLVSLSLVLGALGALVSGFAACVSSSNDPNVASNDASFEYDGGTQPGVDAAPSGNHDGGGIDGGGGDATLPASPDGGSSPDDGGSTPTDGGSGATDAPASYVDVLAPSNWSQFNAGSLDAGVLAFDGLTYDGRYIYFAPAGGNGVVAQLDTTIDFQTSAAWATFNTTSLGGGTFTATAFDGRYVYFVPFRNSSGYSQTFVQYDTHGPFTSASSWSQFTAGSGPYWGARFDGRYMYFSPFFYSIVEIYDTQKGFTDSSAWYSFDTSQTTPPEPTESSNDEFGGMIFDGTYMYLLGPTPARVDTRDTVDSGLLDASASWETFSVKEIADAGFTTEYVNGAFDGRYVYMVANGDPHVVQYDTTGPFTSPSSWAQVDLGTFGGNASGYEAVNFDGRYLYLAPYGATLAIYDTQAPFGAQSSWTMFDMTTVVPGTDGFLNLLYDGQYMWTTELSTSVVLRLQVKSGPGPLPALPGYNGSFY